MSQQLNAPNPMLRLLRILVVVGAGVGGWFGYEKYVADQDVAAAEAALAAAPPAVGQPLAPWPVDLVVAEETWADGYVATVQPANDVVRQQMEFDAGSGRSKMSLFAPDGTISAVVEVDADEVWTDQGDGFQQQPPNAVVTPTSLRSAAFSSPALTMHDVFDESVWEYTRFVAESPGPSAGALSRVLTFSIDGVAFASAEPAAAAQWRRNNELVVRDVKVAEIEVEVDSTGHVVGLIDKSDDAPLTLRWSPLVQTPLFTSPISG